MLLIVGVTGRDLIPDHKRLQAYDEIDFDILSAALRNSAGVRLSPNVLTETSNLVRQAPKHLHSSLMRTFGHFIDSWPEDYVPSRTARVRPEFGRLGLADAAILSMAGDKTTILTADFHLYQAALKAGLSCENFHHWKDHRPDYQL
ncbi:hypothetical protein [Kumtagia ephedrae]|uniref:hypothetical protein n=1 Tax=Kumtagia ephedrae TaxID=2116701 RepID=UPI0010574B39|nr:hypothetical protein [Mesorhizobium ephedrae]